jgi:hypothetical protein
MVDISTVFQSKYLSANDIGDEPMLATVTGWDYATMQDGAHKIALSFKEFDRPLVLNKTNARNIAQFCGNDTDDWVGKQIVMVTTLVDYQGQSVDAIRVRAPKSKPPTARPAAVAATTIDGPPKGHPAYVGGDDGSQI